MAKIYSRVFPLLLLLLLNPADSEVLLGKTLLAALRSGGYVILMRHASSPLNPPDAAAANADNPRLERQLDEAGRSSARQMGEALRRWHIPIGHVFSSPTYRALETIKFAQLGQAAAFPELGDSGQSMMADKTGDRAAWLKARTAEPPAPGKNTFIVTHLPNIIEAYPEAAEGLADGEALILHPDGRGAARLVARIKIGEWSLLDTNH